MREQKCSNEFHILIILMYNNKTVLWYFCFSHVFFYIHSCLLTVAVVACFVCLKVLIFFFEWISQFNIFLYIILYYYFCFCFLIFLLFLFLVSKDFFLHRGIWIIVWQKERLFFFCVIWFVCRKVFKLYMFG